jgi:hypothetical protein
MTAVVTHIPVVLHPQERLAGGGTDSLQQAWAVAWGGFALAHRPLEFFDGNAFWPLKRSLAFSDSLAGYAPAALGVDGPSTAALRYNLLYVLAYALAFAGAYLLSRELGAPAGGAAIAGAAFAYAPWRLAHGSHLNILSSGGIPLSLFLLVRGWRRGSGRTVFAGWAVAAWQISLGFNLGLQLLYLLALVVAVLGALCLRDRRKPVQLGANLAGVALVLATSLAFAIPYLQVRSDHPESARTPFDVATFSPVPKSFFTAPDGNAIWGRATGSLRESLRFPSEQSLFPGLVVVVLASAGALASPASRSLRWLLSSVAVVCAVLSLGFHTAVRGVEYVFPYRWLYELAPGFDGLRTPGRINTITSLALALLAAFGVGVLTRRAGSRAAAAVVVVLFAAVVAEGSGRLSTPTFARPSGLSASVPEPQLHLPFDGKVDPLFMLWSTEGFPRMLNGGSGFEPRLTATLRTKLVSFPDAHTVALLRSLGVRSVVVHRRLAAGTDWARAETRPIAGLPLTRHVGADTVVFLLPGSARVRR